MTRFLCTAMASMTIAIPFAGPALAAVEPSFDLSDPSTAPFPSDRFTVPDDPGDPNNTGLRVDLPMPDCASRPGDCSNIETVNKLDGFNLLPRISIPFSGAIDPGSVGSRSVFFVRLGTAVRRDDDQDGEDDGGDAEQRESRVIGINQAIWDPATNTLHAHADELLEQYTRYLLVVTTGIRDAGGAPIEPADRFERFLHDDGARHGRDATLERYRKSLHRGLERAKERLHLHRRSIAAASVFTTQTVTSVLERIRDRIDASTPAPATFLLATDPAVPGPGTARALFSASAIEKMVFREHVGFSTLPSGDRAPKFTLVDRTPSVALLRIFDGAVGQIAFGKFAAPVYLAGDGLIPIVGTLAGIPAVQQTGDLHFTLFLPSGERPSSGWPVAIFGHGLGQHDKNLDVFTIAGSLAAHGIATIAINFVGHGFGPAGTLALTLLPGGRIVSVPAGGRGEDRNGDGIIGPQEGFNLVPPGLIVARDSRSQSAIDLMQLVRVIQVGMDADGDGVADLDASRVYYVGQSLGATVGIMAVALDRGIRASVLNVMNGLQYEEFRLGTVFRPQLGVALANRIPRLFNNRSASCPGNGCAAFDENLPFRDQPPLTNDVAGAMGIQELLDRGEWVSMQAAPIAFAPHLRKEARPDVPARPVLIQIAKGDQTAPNTSTSALLRAGDLLDRTTLFRNDLAFAAPPCSGGAGKPCVDKDPHRFLTRTDASRTAPNFAIALQAQEQVATFFASDGSTIVDPDGAGGPLFEVPIRGQLPEELGYIP